ncbi:MAG TPA: chemotaxis protein CheW [Geobacteraceae bacterium]|nr:chemotaxis protein CheW [Geobacteraceae bacterium]
MNLSEIRKKAQQERAAGGGEIASGTGNGGACVDEPAANPEPVMQEETAPPSLADEFPAEPLVRPEAPPAPPFDPLAVILAGRAAATGDNGSGEAAPCAGEAEEDFREFLCFRVAGERYGVDIMEIKEIIKPREVTEVPRMPEYVSGVISLRGVIIPVFDMHRRLGHAVSEGSRRERIIVVKRGEELFGVTVDEVIQVARISADGVEPPPAVLEGIDRDFVGGIGRHDGKMLILLNLAKVLDLSLC